MIIYILRRFMTLFVTLFFLLQLSFCVLYLNNDAPLHLLPFFDAYSLFWNKLFHGEFGFSLAENQMIISQLKYALPATIELCFLAFVLALLVGIPLGILSGLSNGKKTDNTLTIFTLISSSTAIIWLILLVSFAIAIHFHFLPALGQYESGYQPDYLTGFFLIDIWFTPLSNRYEIIFNTLKHLILPLIVLSLAPMIETIRLMRFSTDNVFRQNYIKAASTRGLSSFTIIRRHVIHNALPPIIPQLGIQFSTMLTLTMLTEIIFKWQGLGPWVIEAFYQQEYVSIAVVLVITGSLIAIINLIGDIIGAFANPLKHKEQYAL